MSGTEVPVSQPRKPEVGRLHDPGLFNKAMVGTTARLLPSAAAAAMNAKFVEIMLPDLVGEPAAG